MLECLQDGDAPEEWQHEGCVLSKLAADQLLLTPIFTAIFLSYIKISEGRIDLVMPYLQVSCSCC